MPSSVTVALGIVLAFVILSVVSIWKYGADEAIKVIIALTAFFGAPLGAIGAYFFTRTEVAAAHAEATAARNVAVQYKAQLASVSDTATEAKVALVQTIDSKPATYTIGELKSDAHFKDAVRKLDAASVVVHDGVIWQQYPPAKYEKPGEMAEQKK
jgi:hypothetical protein